MSNDLKTSLLTEMQNSIEKNVFLLDDAMKCYEVFNEITGRSVFFVTATSCVKRSPIMQSVSFRLMTDICHSFT